MSRGLPTGSGARKLAFERVAQATKAAKTDVPVPAPSAAAAVETADVAETEAVVHQPPALPDAEAYGIKTSAADLLRYPDVDLAVLEQLVAISWQVMNERYPA